MGIPVALAFVLALAPAARADCPPDCVAGGGPSATDCFVAWSGLPGMSETCADGEACDIDGKVDRSEEHTSELQPLRHLVCRRLLEKTNMIIEYSGLGPASGCI